jgi:HSP20 family molecular chaperone IbpA
MRRPRLELPPLARLREQLEDMFNQPDLPMSGWFSGWTPAVDVIEDKDRLTVKAELPGFRREDIDVSLHENNLTICGERKYEMKSRKAKCFVRNVSTENSSAPFRFRSWWKRQTSKQRIVMASSA